MEHNVARHYFSDLIAIMAPAADPAVSNTEKIIAVNTHTSRTHNSSKLFSHLRTLYPGE